MRNLDVSIFMKHPYLILFILSGVCLLVAMMNSHNSADIQDYREMEGYICNVEENQELWHGRYVTRYSYDIVWYDDGQEYSRHLDGQMDKEQEGAVTIWVHPENLDAVLSGSEDIGDDTPVYLLISIVTAIIGYILFKMKFNEKRMSRPELEDYLLTVRISSMLVVVLAVIGAGIFVVTNYYDMKNGEYVRPSMYDPAILCGGIAIIGLFQFFKAGRKMKKMGF